MVQVRTRFDEAGIPNPAGWGVDSDYGTLRDRVGA
jgi:hypothetical protein